MKNIKVNPIIAFAVILIAILACYGIYQGIASLNDEAFYRGFNAGSESQKLLDDQKQETEKRNQRNKQDKSVGT